jgi:hypothetical protein
MQRAVGRRASSRRAPLEQPLAPLLHPPPKKQQPGSCPITAERLSDTDGYDEFEGRRREKFTKIIAGGITPARGLDEGVDRELISSPPLSSGRASAA